MTWQNCLLNFKEIKSFVYTYSKSCTELDFSLSFLKQVVVAWCTSFRGRVKSCDSSTLIRCTPILIWSCNMSILIQEKSNLAQNDGRELCMLQKQINLSFWFSQTILQSFSNISNILQNSLNEPKTQISLLLRHVQLYPIILSQIRLFSD